jgi:ABC-type multidrug transport system permease subunit/predicted  nucleic acid-binding Zn-ribbon protein
MSKIIPLIKANVKGFVRNWKNIIILVILPLVLISIIFASFNPNGIRRINIGYTLAEDKSLDEQQFRDALGSFTKLTKYDTLDGCKHSLRDYHEYVCVEIRGQGPYTLEVYYDNTREPVIWEVIQRLEEGIRSIQRHESKSIASDFLTRFRTALGRLDTFDTQLAATNKDLDSYVRNVDDSVIKLHNARDDLVTNLDSMDRDIADARAASSDARSTEANYANAAYGNLNAAQSLTQQVSWSAEQQGYSSMIIGNIVQARSTVSDLDQNVRLKLDNVDAKLDKYDESSRKGRQYVFEIDNAADRLGATKSDLRQYQQRVGEARDEISSIRTEFSALTTLDADTLVDPVIIHNTPAYVPVVDEKTAQRLSKNATQQEAAVRGISLISLQTIFPTVLILITVFLSLLIGSFVALSEITSPAHARLRLVRHVFLPEFIASFVSALCIVLVPVLLVLLIGDQLFRLGLLSHLLTASSMIVILISIFILLGFLLAYVVRKESMTLMISTFILVLIIFLSGFLLPIERMSPFFGKVAEFSPGALTTNMFKQSVFYGAGFSSIAAEFTILIVELVIILALTLAVRYWHERS